MRARQNIWLTEYEGLVPVRPRERDRSAGGGVDYRTAPAEPRSPHFEAAPADPLSSTPTAFLE